MRRREVEWPRLGRMVVLVIKTPNRLDSSRARAGESTPFQPPLTPPGRARGSAAFERANSINGLLPFETFLEPFLFGVAERQCGRSVTEFGPKSRAQILGELGPGGDRGFL